MGPILAFTLVLVACGGPGGNIDREGCALLDGGAFTPVVAGTVRDPTAPAITSDQRAYTVTLPPSGVGYLSFDSTDDTEYAGFFDRTVAFAVFDAAGTMFPLAASSTSSSECATVHGRHIFELPVAPFYLAFGPDPGAVNVVILPYNPD